MTTVLFLSHSGVLGGAELSLLDLVRARAGPSRVVLFAEGPFAQRLREERLPVEVMPLAKELLDVRRDQSSVSAARSAAASASSAARLVRSLVRIARTADLVYANSQKAFVLGSIAARVSRKPFVWHLRDLITSEHFGRRQRQLCIAIANRSCACVVANSRATAEAFVEAGGRPDLVRVVYNGLPTEDFDAVTGTDANGARAELGLAGAKVVGAFGRLARWKGQHVLIEAIARLDDVHAMIVGAPLFGEDEYAASLRRCAERLGLANRVHFLGFRTDVARLMKASDIIAHTSVAAEPFGRVVVEAMLAGTPVIATDAGGAREIVEDGRTGRLVPRGDADALAKTIGALLAGPDEAERLAARANEDARRRFSLASYVEGIESVIKTASASPQSEREPAPAGAARS